MIVDDYLLKYFLSFLGDEELFQMSKVSKRMKTMIHIPEHYGKRKHFKKLTKKHTIGFLFDCVQNYTQAFVLYTSLPNIMTKYYITSLKDRHIKKIFRNIMYREYTTSKQQPMSKLLRVI